MVQRDKTSLAWAGDGHLPAAALALATRLPGSAWCAALLLGGSPCWNRHVASDCAPPHTLTIIVSEVIVLRTSGDRMSTSPGISERIECEHFGRATYLYHAVVVGDRRAHRLSHRDTAKSFRLPSHS